MDGNKDIGIRIEPTGVGPSQHVRDLAGLEKSRRSGGGQTLGSQVARGALRREPAADNRQ